MTRTRGNRALGAKKSRAGKKGRGMDAFSPKLGKGKDEAALQARIDMVVAQARAADHSTDVMNSYRQLRFHSSGLKALRLG